MMCWTLGSSLPNRCQNVWMWIRRQFLSTSDGIQQAFWLDLSQWVKHGYARTIQRQRSGSTLVYYLIHKCYKHKTLPPKWWRRFSRTVMGYAGWSNRKGCNSHRKLLHTSLGQNEAGIGLQTAGKAVKRSAVSPGQCLLTHGCLQTTICSQTLTIFEQDEIFYHWGFHICCRWLVCSPNFSILSERSICVKPFIIFITNPKT